MAKQIEALVPTLEAVAGARLDGARLGASVGASRECSDLWEACLGTAAARPAPLTFFDGTIHMGPPVVLRGTEEACAYYRALHAELKSRVLAGVAAVPGEALRLYWDGIAVVGAVARSGHDLRRVRNGRGGVHLLQQLDLLRPRCRHPLRSMARASLKLFIARSEEPKEQYIERIGG